MGIAKLLKELAPSATRKEHELFSRMQAKREALETVWKKQEASQSGRQAEDANSDREFAVVRDHAARPVPLHFVLVAPFYNCLCCDAATMATTLLGSRCSLGFCPWPPGSARPYLGGRG